MRELLNFIKPYVVKNKRYFSIVTLFIIGSSIVQTMVPRQIKNVLDTIEITNSNRDLLLGFWIIIFLGTLDYIFAVGMRYYNNRFSQEVLFDIRQDIFSKLQGQEMDFYAGESIGQIMARTIEESLMLNDIFRWGYRIGLLTLLLFIGAIYTMWMESPVLAIVFALLGPILLIILSKMSKNNTPIFYRTRETYGDMNDTLAENFAGIKTIKSFGREEEQIKLFEKKNDIFFQASKKEIHIRAMLQPLIIFFINIGLILIVFVAGGLVRQSIITASSFIAFMLLMFQLARPGRFLGELSVRIQMANTAAIRLNEVLKSDTEIKNSNRAIELNAEEATITFENVSFKYPNSKVNAIENLSFTIPHGQKVLLLGSTGSGKSTLINLIPRFFNTTSGKILINGIDIKNYTLGSLRRFIGIIHQDSFLFTMSICENIAFGMTDIDPDKVKEAAKAAQIHDSIMNFPDAYDTLVGERGVTLSGGQKQRISIARAIITNPKILIFDDSVSAVDPETESRIQEKIGHVDENRTMLVISQRPSSLQYVDRVILLEDGRIVQDGSPSELIKQSGPYREFINAVQHQIKFIDWDIVDNNNPKIEEVN